MLWGSISFRHRRNGAPAQHSWVATVLLLTMGCGVGVCRERAAFPLKTFLSILPVLPEKFSAGSEKGKTVPPPTGCPLVGEWGMASPAAYGIYTPAPQEPPSHTSSYPSHCLGNESEADNSGDLLPASFLKEAASSKALHEPRSASEIQTKQKCKMPNSGQVALNVCEWSTGT